MKKALICVFSVILTVCLCGCSSDFIGAESNTMAESQPVSGEGLLTVRYIDVGQADSILITTPNDKHMLIDAGAELGEKNPAVKEALENENISYIDAVVATHPHYDHIAEMGYVIENYDIGAFYLPDTEGNYTSGTYDKMLEDLEEYNVNTIYPDVPSEFDLDGVKCQILAPLENESKSCNEYSIVMKLSYGDNSFLFTGDAGSQSEYNMIDRGFDLSADVLKVGHHGSEYSTTREFLEEVDPEYAVISCGEDNSYGHPSPLTLSRLEGVTTYITKDDGDIVITSDGSNIEVYTEKDSEPKTAETTKVAEKAYVGNKNSGIFHREDCGSLFKRRI